MQTVPNRHWLLAFRPKLSDPCLYQIDPFRYVDNWCNRWCTAFLQPTMNEYNMHTDNKVATYLHYLFRRETEQPTSQLLQLDRGQWQWLPAAKVSDNSICLGESYYHFFVGFVFTSVTRASRALMHLSHKIVVIIRSKSRFRSQLKLTLTLSLFKITLMDQNGSGTKFLTFRHLSTTKPRVGNWHEPVAIWLASYSHSGPSKAYRSWLLCPPNH